MLLAKNEPASQISDAINRRFSGSAWEGKAPDFEDKDTYNV
jgi:hypothetical protein